ncbi:DUF2683 family protein [Parapedobacter lycopersici]|uniref:DUF2683 family protein n=1 Tax=Parapedobacter lycopersici TaxID=1864939 RepID=UPI00214D50CC|nr:DUF2683 family protein [Parapedobacter lycopersici]
MEAITIHPENAEQLKTVKSMLKALKVPFESQSSSLPDHVTESINKGLEQASEGKTIGLETFKEKHFLKR